MSKRDASIALLNELGPDLGVRLNADVLVHVAYASNFCLMGRNGDEQLILKQLPDIILINPHSLGERLELTLWHGRPNPSDEMADWGYDTSSAEGYPGNLTGDAFIITKDGVTAVDYNDDGSRTCTMADFHGDVLKYGGEHYWGDFGIAQAVPA